MMADQLDRIAAPEETGEIRETIAELIGHFGSSAVMEAIGDIMPSRTDPLDALQLTRIVAATIVSSRRPRLEAECLCLALGIAARENLSMRKIAIDHGVSVEAVSARVNEICESMGIDRPTICKPEAVRRKHQLTNRARYAKPKPAIAAY